MPDTFSATTRPPTVVVTRPAGQSGELIAQLQARNIAVREFPLIEIAPVDDVAPLTRALAELERYAFVVFVSPNAIERALGSPGWSPARTWPATVPVAVIGPASVAALARHGISPPAATIIWPAASVIAPAATVISPASHDESAGPTDPDMRFDSEALLSALDAALGLGSIGGSRVLLIRGDGGRELLAQQLRAAGAQVEIVAAYRRLLPDPDPEQWRTIHRLLAGTPHVWLLTSSEGARNLLALARDHLNPLEIAALLRAPLVVPHPRIAETARRLGFDTITISGAGDANVSRALFHSVEQLASPRMTDSTATPPEPNKPSAGSPLTGRASVPPNKPFTPYEAQQRRAGGGKKPGSGTPWPVMLLIVLVILFLLGAGIGGFALNRKVDRVRQEFASRQVSNDAQTVENRIRTQQAVDTVHQLDTQLAQVSGKLADAQSEQQALQQAYQELAHNRDDWTLAEIGQTLSSASQQLQLTGNVSLALFALQSADARLAGASSPQLLAVRKALAHDIDALKAAPNLDLSGLAIKLDDAIGRVDALPLAGEALAPRASSAAASSTAAAATTAPAAGGTSATSTTVAATDLPITSPARWRAWWNRFMAGLSQQLTSLVQVRTLNGADAYLVSPDQGYFLRANLKLRLLSARLSLLARNQVTLRSDLQAADAMLVKYFDANSKTTQTVLGLVREVEPASADLQLPNLNASLAAVHQFKSGS